MGNDINKPVILIVDDTPDNIDVLDGILSSVYEVKATLNGDKALKIARSEPKPDMILLDVMMPGIDGFEVCRRLKSDPVTSNIPVIFVTAKNDNANEKLGFDLGAVDYIVKPVSPPIVTARVRTHLALSNQKRELEKQVFLRTTELNETRLKIIQRLGRAAEYKDNETGMHILRMSHYTKAIAQAYGGNDEWVEMIFNAAPMHDIGKIGIPDKILSKPGKLDKDEWEIMQQHTMYGAKIIGDDLNPLLQLSRIIALSHHEKWDGSGYPNGLAGKDIPLEGRIVAIADVFDALTSDRPYKKAWSIEDTVQYMTDSSGTHFDPEIIPIFIKILPDILRIKIHYSEK